MRVWIISVMLVLVFGCLEQRTVNQDDLNSPLLSDAWDNESPFNENPLPDSFSLFLYADGTSSGGSRYYNTNLTFDDRRLISGWHQFESWPGTGGQKILQYNLDVDSMSWRLRGTGEEEKDLPYHISNISYEAIVGKINSGEYKTFNECKKFDICYKII